MKCWPPAGENRFGQCVDLLTHGCTSDVAIDEPHNPPEINPRDDLYDAALPAYGITFLRQRVFHVLRDGPVHAHRDQTQVLAVVDGRLTLRLESTRHRLAAGEAVVVPMGVAHCLAAAGSTDPLTLIDLRVVAGAHHDLGRLLEALPPMRRLGFARGQLAQAAADLAAAARATGWRRAPRVLAGLWQLVAALDLAEAEAPLAGEQGVTDYRLRRAEAFIVHNLADEIGVEQIASAAGLSRSQLTRLYRQQLGVGPAQRLRDYRITAARRLLASGRMSVKEVAHAVGFRWIHHFTRTYRALRGHTPSADLGVDD
jgi:AraC-like DNA-binding protein/mannose-6-phosphate isomerase-like protein (cupin superfamily)